MHMYNVDLARPSKKFVVRILCDSMQTYRCNWVRLIEEGIGKELGCQYWPLLEVDRNRQSSRFYSVPRQNFKRLLLNALTDHELGKAALMLLERSFNDVIFRVRHYRDTTCPQPGEFHR